MIEQPFKIPYVAAVVLHANTHKPDVAAEMVKRTAEFCQQHLASGNWRTVKLILRFLACLSGLFGDDGVFPILDELFNRAVDLQTASAEDVCEDAPPCCGEEAGEQGASLTLSYLDPRTGARQNHSFHHSLRTRFISHRSGAKGRRAAGEDGHCRIGAPCPRGTCRPIPSGR